jgi:hypothetical protein
VPKVQPTITISIVCSPEQLADVQARVSALQADLYRLDVAFSVSTHHDPPPGPSMSLRRSATRRPSWPASRRRNARSTLIPSWARRQRALLEEQNG